MTTQAGARIRLVKCPGCRKILTESPDVSMYKCGWCGIVLLAKIPKSETSQPAMSSQQTGSAGESHQDSVLGQTEDRSSTDHLTDSPIATFSMDADNLRCQDECDDSVELSHRKRASDGRSGSLDITSPHSERFSLEVPENLVNNPLHISKSNDHGEWTDGSNSSNEPCSSVEISFEAEAYISEASEHVDQLNLRQLEEKNNGESQSGQLEGDNFVDEVHNLPEYEQESVLPERMKDDYVHPENYESCLTSSINQNGEIKAVGQDSHSDDDNHVATSAELVDNLKGRSSITERSVALNPGNSICAPRTPSKGSLVSFYLSSDDEQLDHDVGHNFQRFDTMGSSHLGDFGSERNFRPYHPTSRNYYAYDGSESSYDGIDDQVREHPSRKDKGTEDLTGDGLSRVNNEAERNYWATSPSHRAMHIPGSRGKSAEANRYTGRNRMRLNLQEDISRSQFPSRNHIGHRHNLPPPHPSSTLSNKSSYSDPHKSDLLRTVYHLTDQLQRMQFPKPMHTRRFPEEENFSPSSYNLLPSERDLYTDMRHGAGRVNRRGEGYNDSRMAFSGEAAHFRHQARCSCLHCCSHDRHYSAELPWCSKHHDTMSPHRCASSEPSSSWDSETKFDNQRRAEIKQPWLREKYQMAKRHLRPIAGGAPLIVCYHCSELLQLPVDFLLFKKKCHKLMCNACKKILKFSLLEGTTHLVPYVPDAYAPPPSEAGAYKEASGQRKLEAVLQSRLWQLNRDSYNRKTSSGSSHEPIMDRKLKGILKEARGQNDGSVGPSSRIRDWGNATTSVSEREEMAPLANSPLHRLMGYSTPSKVFVKR